MAHRLRSLHWSRAIAQAALATVLLATVSCGGQQQLSSGPDTRAYGGGQLFAEVLDDIGEYYIEPVSSRRLALAGAARLGQLDKRLAVSEIIGGGGSLALSYDGRALASYAAPGEADAHGWGSVLETIVGDARHASPELAAQPPERIEQTVIDGMTRTLDRFSRYASPDLARDQRAARDGWGGIGITVGGPQDLFHVTAVAPQSPAERAGIRPEDQIVAIDGIATRGCAPREVIERLRGPVGSPIALTVLQAGMAQPRELRLRRASVFEPTVTASRDGDIAVIRVHTFNHRTTRRVAESIANAQREAGGRLAGIVLDLRSNPGGVLDEAVNLADLFLRDGPIVSVVGRHPASRQYFAASGRSTVPDLPMVALINGGSASASEIVAAALQDAGRAVVIGSSSYGKGSVQTVLRMPNSGELILTWGRLQAPSGYQLHRHGVIPTICTADLADDANALATGLRRVSAAAAAVPRSALDERAWAELRHSCPMRRSRPEVDTMLAKQVLASPQLYAAARHAAPATARVAQTAVPVRRAMP